MARQKSTEKITPLPPEPAQAAKSAPMLGATVFYNLLERDGATKFAKHKDSDTDPEITIERQVVPAIITEVCEHTTRAQSDQQVCLFVLRPLWMGGPFSRDGIRKGRKPGEWS